MSSKIPLFVENGNTAHDYPNSGIMLTTLDDSTPTQPNYGGVYDEEAKVLLPGQELMTRDQVPWYPAYYYVIYFSLLIGAPFVLGFLSYIYIEDANVEEYSLVLLICHLQPCLKHAPTHPAQSLACFLLLTFSF